MLNEKADYMLVITFVMLVFYLLSQDTSAIGPF